MSRGLIRDDVTDSEGNALQGILVTIYNAGTAVKATLYSASAGGTIVSNPLTTDNLGVFTAYAETAEYDYSVAAPSGTVVISNQSVFDADDLPALDAAITAAVDSTAADAATATTQAGIATTQAGIATTKASEASADADSVATALADLGDLASAIAVTEADAEQTALDRIATGEDVTATETAQAAAEAAANQAQNSQGIYPDTASALSDGVADYTSITGGSGGTNGTFDLIFTGGAGSDAAAVFTVAGGALVSITGLATGYNYTSAPTLDFTNSSGLTGASATAVLGQNVSDGEFFSIPSASDDGYLDLYENVADVATFVDTYPNADSVAGINDGLSALEIFDAEPVDLIIPFHTDIGGNVVLGYDTDRQQIVGDFPDNYINPVRPKTALTNTVTLDERNGFISWGQSLSNGGVAASAISTTQPYNNLTFTNGVRSNSFATEIALVENTTDSYGDGGTPGETICTTATSEVVTRCLKRDGVLPSDNVWFASAPGKNGASIAQLSKGGATFYERITDHIEGAYDLAVTAGESYTLHAVTWIQGEADLQLGTTQAAYKASLLTMLSDIQTDYETITGNTNKIQFLSYQSSDNVLLNGDEIILATNEVVEENENFHRVTPIYFLPHVDRTHLNATGYNLFGRYYGRALKDLVDGFVPDSCYIKSAYVVGAAGTEVIINVHSPSGTMAFDARTVGQVTDKGFKILDDTGTLTLSDITIISETRLSITVNRALGANPKLRYGLDYGGNNNPSKISGPQSGSSGNLRDNTYEVYTVSSEDYPLHHWCHADELDIVISE